MAGSGVRQRHAAAVLDHHEGFVVDGHQRLDGHIKRILRGGDGDFARRVHARAHAGSRRIKGQLDVIGRHAAGTRAHRRNFIHLAGHFEAAQRVDGDGDLLADFHLDHIQLIHGDGQVHVLALEDGAQQRAAGDLVALGDLQRRDHAVAGRDHDQVLSLLLGVGELLGRSLALQAHILDRQRQRRVVQAEERFAAVDLVADLRAGAADRSAERRNRDGLVRLELSRADDLARRIGHGHLRAHDLIPQAVLVKVHLHRQIVLIDGDDRAGSLPRQIDNGALGVNILPGDGHALVKRKAQHLVLRRQFDLHPAIGREDRQRALAPEDGQRVVARFGVDGCDASLRRGFDRRHLAAGGRIADGLIQIPERKLKIGDRIVDLLVCQHSQNIALFHLIADINAELRQRTVRFGEQIRLAARRGCARAVDGFLHCAPDHRRSAVALRFFSVVRLAADICLCAKERSSSSNDQQHNPLDPLTDCASPFSTALLLGFLTHG